MQYWCFGVFCLSVPLKFERIWLGAWNNHKLVGNQISSDKILMLLEHVAGLSYNYEVFYNSLLNISILYITNIIVDQ